MKWLEWPARIRDFLSHKLWEIEPEARSRLSALRILLATLRTVSSSTTYSVYSGVIQSGGRSRA